MPSSAGRVFTSKTFARPARKAGVSDAELCVAIQEVMAGQAEDLGGGVWKKRLDANRSRSIILAKGRRFWIYEYLFAKVDRANIRRDELAAFRLLAAEYARLQDAAVMALLERGHVTEICQEMP